MIRYIIRRLLFAVPTLIALSFIVFALLDLAPSDPTGQLPLTIPPEVRAQIRESLGLGQPFHVRYFEWMAQFFVNEPLNVVEQAFGVEIGDSSERLRVRSWATRSPVVDLIVERMPQTLWVVGLSYIVGILIAIPIGIISAYTSTSASPRRGAHRSSSTGGSSMPISESRPDSSSRTSWPGGREAARSSPPEWRTSTPSARSTTRDSWRIQARSSAISTAIRCTRSSRGDPGRTLCGTAVCGAGGHGAVRTA